MFREVVPLLKETKLLSVFPFKENRNKSERKPRALWSTPVVVHS